MKTFIIQEKFVGYADVHIEADTEEEAIALYNRGHYKDSDYYNELYNWEYNDMVDYIIEHGEKKFRDYYLTFYSETH